MAKPAGSQVTTTTANPNPVVMQLHRLTDNEPDFGKIEYLVKLGLRSTSVDIASVHALNSPQANQRFEHGFHASNIIDCFINTKELSEHNSVQNIVQRGGRVALSPEEPMMVFPTGNIRLPTNLRDAGERDPRKRQVHELVYCRVAVGHALVLERDKITRVRDISVPEGYDSIKIHTTEEEDDPEAENDPNYYYHEYLLNDEARVLPMFLVSFLFDPDSDKRKRQPLCEACEQQPAKLYCLQDNAKLCDACDLDLHSKSRVLEKHHRVDINEVQGNLSLSRCREHPDMPVQFFDTVNFQAVCVHCKMVGSHSTGDNAHHPLLPISEAYKENLSSLQREREVVDQKEKHIEAQLQHIDERLRQVHLNASQVEKELREMLTRVIAKLQRETQTKLHLLLSDESELKRQLHYYKWLDAFLKYQRDVADPVEFLQSFRHHGALLRSLPSEFVDTSPVVMNDLRVVGDIDIESYVLPSAGRVAPRAGASTPAYAPTYDEPASFAPYSSRPALQPSPAYRTAAPAAAPRSYYGDSAGGYYDMDQVSNASSTERREWASYNTQRRMPGN